MKGRRAWRALLEVQLYDEDVGPPDPAAATVRRYWQHALEKEELWVVCSLVVLLNFLQRHHC